MHRSIGVVVADSMEYSQGEGSDMEWFQEQLREESKYLLKESEYETEYEEEAKEKESDTGPMDNSKEVVEEEVAVPVRRLKRRRKAGEISGRQLALKKIEKEGSREWNCPFPPPFLPTVTTMRKSLTEFSDGKSENFDAEAASAMWIYISRKLGIDTRVSSCSFTLCY